LIKKRIQIHSIKLENLRSVHFLLIWCFIRIYEFQTGFVEFSIIRFFIMCSLCLVFFIKWSWLQTLNSFFKKSNKSIFGILFIFGFSLIVSRFIRNANMGETHLFLESIQNTSKLTGWLENSFEGTTHFAFHNSPGFLLFVPFVWILGDLSSYLFFIFNSLALILSNYFSCIFVNNRVKISDISHLLFLTLFLSAFLQHAKFIDTRFAALGLTLFIIGILIEDKLFFILGFIISLLFRETTVFTCIVILIFSKTFPFAKPLKVKVISIGLAWIGFSLFLFHYLQPEGISIGSGALNRLSFSIFIDWDLKIAYFIRIISFGPFIFFSVPGLFGLIAEFIFPFFSKDYVLYNISWHYWMPAMTISFLYSNYILKEKYSKFEGLIVGYSIFIINTGLWQFFTTFHPRLY
jgi:hypothetical protein